MAKLRSALDILPSRARLFLEFSLIQKNKTTRVTMVPATQTAGIRYITILHSHTMSAHASIIILQYNESASTIRCLEYLKELDHHNFEVVVVDNNSDESHLNNTKQWLQSQAIKSGSGQVFRLIENKANLGYSGGNNIGIESALGRGAEYVLILNNDVELRASDLEKILAVAKQNPGAGLLAPALVDTTGKISCAGKIRWLKNELALDHQAPRRALLPKNRYLTGACLLVKRSVFETIGNLDESYFLYFEDADFCYRAQLAGFQLILLPEIKVKHDTSSSTKQLGSPLLARYHARNALIFNSLNAPLYVKPLIFFWASYVALKQFAKLIFIRNSPAAQRAEAVLEGIFDFYQNRFGKIN